MMRTVRIFGRDLPGAAPVALAGLFAVGLGVLGHQFWVCGGSWTRAFWIGRPLMQVEAPRDGDVLPQGGLEVRVTYPSRDAVAVDTFRCELNGEDVTARVAHRSEVGMAGSIYPLREGVNRLRLGVFGRSLWGGWVEDVVEIEIRARPLIHLDRA